MREFSLVALCLVDVGFGLTLVDLVDLVLAFPPPGPGGFGTGSGAEGGLLAASGERLADGNIAGVPHLTLREERGGIGLAPSYVGRDRVEGAGGGAHERRADLAQVRRAPRVGAAGKLVMHRRLRVPVRVEADHARVEYAREPTRFDQHGVRER